MKIGGKLAKYKTLRKLVRKIFRYDNKILEQDILGIHFRNPVGLAAGFDKDLELMSIVGDIGFGFEEVGSITALPYIGNTGKRLHRLPQSQGIIVNYGLKNKGIDYAISKLSDISQSKEPIFVSIAKSNCQENCDLDVSIEDYIISLKKLDRFQLGSAYILNISCPNSFGGEDFTKASSLEKLLNAVCEIGIKKPILIKMPVDLERNDFDKLVEISVKHKIAGLIISNLIKDRSGIIEKDEITEIKGGISGKPVQQKSDKLIYETYKKYGKQIKIIGVGGIFSAEDAYQKIKNGASLVQLISGMIFEGPQLIGEINHGITTLLKKDGFKNISEAIGANNH